MSYLMYKKIRNRKEKEGRDEYLILNSWDIKDIEDLISYFINRYKAVDSVEAWEEDKQAVLNLIRAFRANLAKVRIKVVDKTDIDITYDGKFICELSLISREMESPYKITIEETYEWIDNKKEYGFQWLVRYSTTAAVYIIQNPKITIDEMIDTYLTYKETFSKRKSRVKPLPLLKRIYNWCNDIIIDDYLY